MKRLIRKFKYIKYRNIRGMRDYIGIYTSDELTILIKHLIILAIVILSMLLVYIKAVSFLGKI